MKLAVLLALALTGGGPASAAAINVSCGINEYPGKAFRDRLHHSLPDTSTIVIIHALAAHLSKGEASIVAWVTPTGVWKVETISEVTSLAPPPPGSTGRPTPMEQPRTERTLSAEDVTRLRSLLADPSLYSEAEQPPSPTAPPLGAAEHEMEIISATGCRRFGWEFRRVGEAGAVADIILR